MRPTQRNSRYSVQACGEEMGEEEKRNGLSTMKRRGTGDLRVERNSLMRIACPATWGHGEVQLVLLLRTVPGSMAMQQQESVSMMVALVDVRDLGCRLGPS